MVRGSPGPSDYVAYEVHDGRVTSHPVGRPPERAELVYSYRPLSELPGILELARGLHARILWTQSGVSAAGVNDPTACWLPDHERKTAHNLAQSSGLELITEPYIVDLVRELKPPSQ